MTNFYLYLIQLWWQFFQMSVYGDIRSLCSNLARIDPEKLYRATFICQYGLCCCIVWPSFLFDCFVKIWATCKNFLGKWFTAPPGRKLPVRLWSVPCEILLFIGSRKKLCFANYLSSYVSLNQALFRCSSLNLKISRLKWHRFETSRSQITELNVLKFASF